MAKKLIAIIEQTIRKEVAIPATIPVGPFSLDAIEILNAVNASNHSTLIKQRFLSAEVVEVPDE